jgi:hypothetical protein
MTLSPDVNALIREAVRDAAGLAVESANSVPSPVEAAVDVVEALAVAHEHDLAAGEADLQERLQARFGPQVLHDPRMLDCIDWTLQGDRAAHEVARSVVGRDLVEAFSAPTAERQDRANKVLEAERARVRARAATRMARATRGVLAALRPPDEALDEPWRPAA